MFTCRPNIPSASVISVPKAERSVRAERGWYLLANKNQLSNGDERGAAAAALLTFLVLVVAGFGALYIFFSTAVPPDKIGVRRNFFSFGILEKGYVQKGLAPGLYLSFPGVSDIVLLPRGFELVHFGDVGPNPGPRQSALEVNTSDGSKVLTDVTMVVRRFSGLDHVDEAKKHAEETPELLDSSAPVPTDIPFVEAKARPHGGPKELIENFGEDSTQQLLQPARFAENELRFPLKKLSTIDFYNPQLREHAALIGHELINRKLNQYGLDVWATLVSRYLYADKGIDQQIFNKNLQTQSEKLQAARADLAKAEQENRVLQEQWNAKITVIRGAAENYARQNRADAELFAQNLISQGKRDVEVAEATVALKKNKLLAEAQASQLLLAEQMVPLVKTITGGVVSGLDPFDIDGWVDRMTGANVERGAGHER